MKIVLLHGPNLNLLGTRQPDIYGITTLREIVEDLRRRADDRGASLRDIQSNHEGALIDFLQEHADANGGIINPGGLAHTSVVLRDAVAASAFPVVEVHITNIAAREPFRRTTYLADVVAHAVIGKGVAGYAEAMDWLLDHLEAGRA
ncbi:MAG TPA: type II 3-dehydroquinate dehydratase [Candidatus Limnocylindria bacterium]|nr:type II 3-dehydroquinate dehydratase [Candidatus Limnocylindria bacterium]